MILIAGDTKLGVRSMPSKIRTPLSIKEKQLLVALQALQQANIPCNSETLETVAGKFGK